MSDEKKPKSAESEQKAAAKQAAVEKLAIELKPKYPHLNEPELLKIAAFEQKKAAARAKLARLEEQSQRVLNPRVNAKSDTRRKVIIGAMLMTSAATDATAYDYVRSYASQLKDSDKNLFDEFFSATPQPATRNVLQLLARNLVVESVSEALAAQTPRFTLTFNTTDELYALLPNLVKK